ncbi:MAG TPA: hypothetical protein VIY48_04540 [Candidatus Paceibacterota bacterium]
MTYYYDGQTRTTDYWVDGRMSIGEVISLLNHLNDANTYERPWIDSFYYQYSEDDNRSHLVIMTCKDRPHNVMGRTASEGASGETTHGSIGGNADGGHGSDER